jgi:tetratricopeptide (TPR) repeat protein
MAGVWSLPARADSEEAIADYKAGRYLEAAAEIQAVVDRSPGYAYGYFLLGHCLLKMGRTKDAELRFRRAVMLEPERAEYYHGFVLALAASGNWPLAIRVASEGLAHARDARTRYALLALRGYAWTAVRRWDVAIGDLDAASRLRAEPWVLFFLGKARFALGQWSDAVPPLRRALQGKPEDPVVLRLLSETFLRLAADENDAMRKKFNYLQAMGYAQRLISVAPDDLDAVHLVGRGALGAGRLDQAENVFRHVLAVNPRQCYALADLGRTYMAAARWVEAEAYLRKASACAPRLAAVYESLGDLYLALGKPQEAAAAFRRVEEIDPGRQTPERPEPIPVFQPR